VSHLRQCGAHHESYEKESVNMRKLNRTVPGRNTIPRSVLKSPRLQLTRVRHPNRGRSLRHCLRPMTLLDRLVCSSDGSRTRMTPCLRMYSTFCRGGTPTLCVAPPVSRRYGTLPGATPP